MRIKNSVKNVLSALFSNVVAIIIGFTAQAIFIKILGSEYLGLNGLFSNILSMMAIVEMGIGSAIIYNLYKPIANNDLKNIKSLMAFYKKSYRIIAIIIFIIGFFISLFLPSIVGEVSLDINIKIVYFLFLTDTICSYLLSYKRSIIYANQKNYIINIIHIFYIIFLNIFQLVILYLTKNYYLYLIIKIVMRIVENIAITQVANKYYGYLKDDDIIPLDENLKKDIFKKTKALFFHQIGGFVVSGTDNIIISKFLGLVMVGLYSNYFLIIDAVHKIFNQIIQSMTASVGNLLVTESLEKQFMIFKRIRFLNFWISTFASISTLIIMDSFISIWIGNEYILPKIVLIVLVLNYFQKSSRYTYVVFKEAAGIYYEDRFVPLIESLVNIVASILLVKIFGLAGVFMGTIISSLVLWIFSYPKYIYKNLFQRDYKNYFVETLGYLFTFIFLGIILYYISTKIVFSNMILNFCTSVLISMIITNILLLAIYRKNENFIYYRNLFFKLLKRN